MKHLPQSFYSKETSLLAKELLGKILIHNSPLGITSGIIVETEAYLGLKDPAAHSYRTMTERNKATFGKPGFAYIYFTYGMHYCFNVTAGPIGIGEGVLLRALEPVDGIEIMKQRRNIKNSSNLENELINLTNGPAKLVQAMGITKDMYGISLINSNLKICKNLVQSNFDIITTTRIGIKEGKELPLRFYIKNNKFVSQKSKLIFIY